MAFYFTFQNIIFKIPKLEKNIPYIRLSHYNSKKGKIPIGVLYHEEKPTLTDKWPQLKNLEKKKVGWKGLK